MTATHASLRRARPQLGTFVEIVASGATIAEMEAAVEAAFAAVATVHGLMSFHEAASDVSRLNRGAASGALPVHDWTYQVLETALDLRCRSAGIFDIAVAPALEEMGLLPSAPLPPSPHKSPGREHKAHGPRGGVQLLPKNYVRFTDPGVKIDLGGIAKGFAVDRAIETLCRHGVPNGLVNAGGDVAAFGPRRQFVDVRDPRHPDRTMCCVVLSNSALASSAGRFDPLRSDRPSGSAIVDPRTGQPSLSICGTTIRAPSCMIADALTKVVMNAGEGTASLLEHYGASALFVTAQGRLHATTDWKDEVRFAA